MARTLRFARLMLFMGVTLNAACSEDPPTNADSGMPRADATNDAETADLHADEAENDAALPDASADVAAPDASLDVAVVDAAADALPDEADGDGACSCTIVDSGLPAPIPGNGILSFPCYCAMPWPSIPNSIPCGSYEAATRCDGPRKDFGVTTYPNCNLVTVMYGGGFTYDVRVYDYTTHELVGAYRGTDYSIRCGTSLVFRVQTGIVPGPECQVAKNFSPCFDAGGGDSDAGDASRDDAGDAGDAASDDADGGCTCELDDQGVGGRMSLACYCAQSRCPDYDTALTTCGPDAPPESNRVEDYEACNLVAITRGASIPSGGSFVYDRTTHELVGASFGADYPAFACGDASVFGYQAGKFPPVGCAKSRSVPRCPRDGG